MDAMEPSDTLEEDWHLPPMEAGGRPSTLFIACGALGREIVALKDVTGWPELTITCLPASWHNYPQRIAPGVQRQIRAARGRYQNIYVLYGDCGTGGELDRVLEEEGVERIPGPHCYQFFMGSEEFTALSDAEPTCFFLTDYLARHFERLIIKGLGLDRHPELRDDYFGNYTKLIYVSQLADEKLLARAAAAAERLGLAFEHRHRSYGELASYISDALEATTATPDLEI